VALCSYSKKIKLPGQPSTMPMPRTHERGSTRVVCLVFVASEVFSTHISLHSDFLHRGAPAL